MSFVQEREKRSNAGSRMRALLDQEVDMEELFEYDENDEEDEEFSEKENEIEEDKLDSDFDLNSSEGEQEYIEEGKELDKQIEKQEKRTRKSAFVPPSAVQTTKKPVERKARQKASVISEEERVTRHSYRKNTMLNRIQTEDQIKMQSRRKAAQLKKDRPVINKLTQEELLAEAAITEEKNKDSLLEWQQKEAERKENAKKKDKGGITGPFIRYHSFADGCGLMDEGNKDSVDSEKRPEATEERKQDTTECDWMGRTLITFVEANSLSGEDHDMAALDNTPDKNLDLVDLIEHLASWREKENKPNKPVLCPITGDIAKYRDPQTGVPYANLMAFKEIKSCLEHQQNWSSANGLYLGNLPSADGFPQNF